MEKVRTLHETGRAKFRGYAKQAKDVASVYAQRIKDLDTPTKKRVLLVGFGVGISNLALSLFSIYTLMSFAIMTGCLALFLKVNFDEIKKKGLIFYIPPKYHEVLLERSLFDIICDVWFIPKITIYLKALISPFILKIEPNEAIHQFKEFSPGARKAILTKVRWDLSIFSQFFRVLSISCLVSLEASCFHLSLLLAKKVKALPL